MTTSVWYFRSSHRRCSVTKGVLKGCSYGGELAQLGGLPRLVEMIFIPRSYRIYYLRSIKKFIVLLEKDCLIK